MLSSFRLTPSTSDVYTFTFSTHTPRHHCHYSQSKSRVKFIRNNTDLICYPKPRDTCIYMGIWACFGLTMQCGHTGMKMLCVALSPTNRKTQSSQWSSPEKIWESKSCRNFHSSFLKSHERLKNSPHHTRQENPSNKGIIGFQCLQNGGSCPSRNWH